MFRHCIIAASIGVLGISSAALHADQAQPPARGSAASITGCLYRQSDIPEPGRRPPSSIAADAYVVVKPPVPGATKPDANARPTGTSGSLPSDSYLLDVVPDPHLRTMVGSRVEVSGRIRKPATAGALAEVEVATIREVEGICPPVASGVR